MQTGLAGPDKYEISKVPFYPQERFYCGPAALATMLAWNGIDVTPDDLVGEVYTPGREGTLAPDIVSAARRRGMLAIEVNDLRAVLNEIEGGNPVLVMQNLSLPWFPQWHFAVAMGYDLAGPQIVLRSGMEPRRVTPLDAFERTWQRAENWAIVILPPHQAPVNMAPTPWLQAIAGLERAGRPADALTAYRRFLRAHPASTLAQLGEANALLALGEYGAAEERYRAVLDAEPDRAAAWNNLAYALHFQGRRNDAVTAAKRAIDASGSDPNYVDTLREVSE